MIDETMITVNKRYWLWVGSVNLTLFSSILYTLH